MLEVAPFRAIRFAAEKNGGDISNQIAPPYDVLDEADKARLLAKSPTNIVAVDLPHVPPKVAGPPEVYARAAEVMASWIKQGTLKQDARPALYLYHQQFEHGGRQFTRRMFIARLRLRAFSDGVILPHEQTFGGPKEDRLALMKATACNLSPIFGLYRDPSNEIGHSFAAVESKPCSAHGTLDGVDNRLWVVDDDAIIRAVAERMANKKVYIADGHHRYGTALMYRDHVKSTAGSPWSDGHAANYVMFVLASMDDPGCLILPYHRVLLQVDLDHLLGAWRPGIELTTPVRRDLLLVDGATGREQALRFTQRGKLAELAPNEVSAWRELDVAYLHRYLIQELLANWSRKEPKIGYVKSEDDARRTAREEKGVALLLNATPMEHLRAVSDAAGLMPQKSTYFHPKLATGMTINSLR